MILKVSATLSFVSTKVLRLSMTVEMIFILIIVTVEDRGKALYLSCKEAGRDEK